MLSDKILNELVELLKHRQGKMKSNSERAMNSRLLTALKIEQAERLLDKHKASLKADQAETDNLIAAFDRLIQG